MFLLHKPRSTLSGYRLKDGLLEPIWLFLDVIWAGKRGVYVAKGNYGPLRNVFVVASDGGSIREELEMTADTPTFYHFAAPRIVSAMFATFALVFEDGHTTVEENVEDISVTLPTREVAWGDDVEVTLGKLSARSASIGLPKHRGRADQPRTHCAFFPGSLDAFDVIQLLERPGFLPQMVESDRNVFIFLIEWRPDIPDMDATLEIYAGVLSSAVDGPI